MSVVPISQTTSRPFLRPLFHVLGAFPHPRPNGTDVSSSAPFLIHWPPIVGFRLFYRPRSTFLPFPPAFAFFFFFPIGPSRDSSRTSNRALLAAAAASPPFLPDHLFPFFRFFSFTAIGALFPPPFFCLARRGFFIVVPPSKGLVRFRQLPPPPDPPLLDPTRSTFPPPSLYPSPLTVFFSYTILFSFLLTFTVLPIRFPRA